MGTGLNRKMFWCKQKVLQKTKRITVNIKRTRNNASFGVRLAGRLGRIMLPQMKEHCPEAGSVKKKALGVPMTSDG